MKQKITGLSRDLIIHPGETLLEIIEDRKMSQKELALRTGFTEKHISKVINGKSPISTTFAKKLEYVLGIHCSFWNNLQTNYNIELAEFEESNNISEEEMEIAKKIKKVISAFKNIIDSDQIKNDVDAVLGLRKLLNIANLTSIPSLITASAFRLKTNTNIDLYILFAWIKLCEISTQEITSMHSLDVEHLKSILPDIRKLMLLSDINEAIEKLKDMLLDCGIIFKLVKHVTGAPVQGFIKNRDDKNMLLCLTIRGAYADIFWFSLFHEIAHILNGDVTNTSLVDYETTENEVEIAADDVASEIILSSECYNNFLEKGLFDIQSIKIFAEKNNLPIWMVIGRLQKDDKIPYNYFADYKLKYKWVNC